MKQVTFGGILALLLLASASCRMFNHKEEEVSEEQKKEERKAHVGDSLSWIICGHIYSYQEESSKDSVGLWLSQGANPNMVFRYDASSRRQISTVPVVKNYLRSSHKSIDYNATALGLAVRYHRLDLVDLLMSAGADINFQKKFVPSALDEAFLYGDEALIRELLDRGAMLSTVNQEEVTEASMTRLLRKLERESGAQ